MNKRKKILHIASWEKFQLSERQMRRYKDGGEKRGCLPWVPFWYIEVLHGNTFEEFKKDEAGVWFGLWAIAAMCKPRGYLGADINHPYDAARIARFLNEKTTSLISRTLERCLEVGKLEWVYVDTLEPIEESSDAQTDKPDATTGERWSGTGKSPEPPTDFEVLAYQLLNSVGRKYIEPVKTKRLTTSEFKKRIKKWAEDFKWVALKIQESEEGMPFEVALEELKQIVRFVCNDYYPEKRTSPDDWIGWAQHVISPKYIWKKFDKLKNAKDKSLGSSSQDVSKKFSEDL